MFIKLKYQLIFCVGSDCTSDILFNDNNYIRPSHPLWSKSLLIYALVIKVLQRKKNDGDISQKPTHLSCVPLN